MPALQVSTIADLATVVATANYSFVADSHKIRSVQMVGTATTAAFSIKLQYSNDNTNWTDFTSATTVSNANFSADWQVLDTKDAKYWRVNSTRTSGTLLTLKIYVANIERT
jgi:hypothetical protein